MTGSSIQIPISDIEPQKWTIVQINIFSILDENGKNFSLYINLNSFTSYLIKFNIGMFSKSSEEKKFYLRSFQICSNQFFRGLMTSDIEYNVSTFPKDLALKSKNNEEWFKEYSWISIGKSEEADFKIDPKQIKENSKKTKSDEKAKRPKSALRSTFGKPDGTKTQGLKNGKKVAFSLDKNERKFDKTEEVKDFNQDITLLQHDEPNEDEEYPLAPPSQCKNIK